MASFKEADEAVADVGLHLLVSERAMLIVRVPTLWEALIGSCQLQVGDNARATASEHLGPASQLGTTSGHLHLFASHWSDVLATFCLLFPLLVVTIFAAG